MSRILVVEDEDSVRENILDLLTIEGYHPIPARDGEEAVKLAWENKPDLIICDIALPHLDGYGVQSKLSRDPLTSTIPFIFLTALSSQEEIRKGMGSGVDDYITKPFELVELLKAIEIRLEKKQAISLNAVQKQSETIAVLNKWMPFDMIGLANRIIRQSDLLIEQGKRLGDPEIQDLAGQIRNVSKQILNLSKNFLFLSNIEEVIADADRVQLHRQSLTTDAHFLLRETIHAVASNIQRDDDLTLELAATHLRISYDHLLKIIEEVLEFLFHTSAKGDRVNVTGIPLVNRGLYQMQFECSNLIMDDRSARSPEKPGFYDHEVNGPGEGGPGLQIVKRVIDLYRGELRIMVETGKPTKISLALPLAVDGGQ